MLDITQLLDTIRMPKKKKMLYLFLFLIVFSYFLWLNATPSFSDPDSFYHAKISEMIAQNGIVKDFMWLPYTTLNDVYIDHHLLYHLILAPFTLILDSLLVTKLFAVLFATLAIIAFQWLLDKFKIKYSFVYTLVILLSHQFIFRINLAKVPALSLIFLFLFIYYLFKYQNKWSWMIFIISFSYVWLYAGWPIMIGLALIYWFIGIIYKYIESKKLFFNLNWKLFFNFISGFIAGLVVNPYFPTNLKFYYQQTFQIGIINYKDIIGVGGEWYGLNIFDFIGYQVFPFILLALALLVFFIYLKKQSTYTWTMLFLTLIFFILTLKSQRNIEYFIPFALLFSALSLNSFIKLHPISYYIEKLKKINKSHGEIVILLLILFILYLPITFSANLKGVRDNLRKNYSFKEFSGISNWFLNNTQAGDIIFHDDWDDWPVLFYNNSYNRYIVGLDPTFMYLKDSNLYNSWVGITTGKIKKNICATIKNKFNSNYIFIKFDKIDLNNSLQQDNLCSLTYQDSDGWIYKIN